MYQPALSRFQSRDPLGADGVDLLYSMAGIRERFSRSDNLHGYCNNNPVNFVDPSGLFCAAGCTAGDTENTYVHDLFVNIIETELDVNFVATSIAGNQPRHIVRVPPPLKDTGKDHIEVIVQKERYRVVCCISGANQETGRALSKMDITNARASDREHFSIPVSTPPGPPKHANMTRLAEIAFPVSCWRKFAAQLGKAQCLGDAGPDAFCPVDIPKKAIP